jgi:hypothetical protein
VGLESGIGQVVEGGNEVVNELISPPQAWRELDQSQSHPTELEIVVSWTLWAISEALA